MQLTTFGANGKVGRLVVEKAPQQWFRLVAFSHDKTNFKANHNLQIALGDIYNFQDVDKAVRGSDVVICVRGSLEIPNKFILTVGMKNIIPTMRVRKIKRRISLTSADAFLEGDKDSKLCRLTHLLTNLIAKKILQDSETHTQRLKNSSLGWTVLRSPVISDEGEPKHFILTNEKLMPWSTIIRRSVAYLIEQINYNGCIQRSPYVKRSYI